MAGAKKNKKENSVVVTPVNSPKGTAEKTRSGKRKRVSDFASKKQKTPRQAAKVSEEDGDKIISNLLDKVTQMGESDFDSNNEGDSELKELKDAILEAHEAHEDDDSDMKSLAASSSEEESDAEMVEEKEEVDPGTKEDAEASEESEDANQDAEAGEESEDANQHADEDSESSEEEFDEVKHREQLMELKEKDPDFFKYLEQNDANLLNFEADDAKEVDEEEELSDDDAEEDNEEKETKKKDKPVPEVKMVDLAYLKNLEKELSAKRTSLRACQDLLRIFRSGRELAVSNDVVKRGVKKSLKAKRLAKHQRKGKKDAGDNEDDEDCDEEFVDDASYVAGKVRFASANVYQKAMNMAIVRIQETLDTLLDKPKKQTVAWYPEEHKRWKKLKPMFQVYVYHLLALTEHMKDAATLRFLLKRLEHLVPYTKHNGNLTRKLVKRALEMWGATSDVSRETKLRAFFLLYALAGEESNTELVLKKVCSSYMTNIAAVCNERTLPSILFAVNCIVELFGIDMGTSYSIAFTQLRNLAVTLRTVITSKDQKSDIDKVYNWSTINNIRLWSKILVRFGGEDELESLIYPFVQVSLGILKLQGSPKSYPLRFHVCNFIIDVCQASGVYVPMAPHILVVLKCAELRQLPKAGKTNKVLDWKSMLRVDDDIVSSKAYLGGIIRNVVFYLSKYAATMDKHASFPEIAHAIAGELQKVAKDIRVSDWKKDIMDLKDQLKKTAKIVSDARGKSTDGPKDFITPLGMKQGLKGIKKEMKTPIARLYEIELKRIEREDEMKNQSRKGKKAIK